MRSEAPLMKGDLTLFFSLDCKRELTHARSSDLWKKSVNQLYPAPVMTHHKG